MKHNYTKIIALSALLLSACYAHGREYASDTDVVFTTHSPEYVFKSKSTFAIPDKIVKITGNVVTGDPPKYVDAVVGTALLSQISKNMTALGYTKVDISQSPDLIL